jgi:hypothetical protein
VTVWCGTQKVGSGTVDLADLNDRQRLNAECAHLDGQIGDWLAYLMHTSDAITAQMQADAGKRLQVVQLSTVRPVRVDYHWKPFLPKGRPVAVEGDPGIGKSALVMMMIAHLTSGKGFPTLLDGMPPPRDFPPQNVCILTSEDDAGDTLRPRLEVNGGDPQRVYQITGWEQPDGDKGIVTMQDLELLRQALEQYHPALLVFDPMQSFFGRGVDMNHANDTRPILDAVAVLCKHYDCTPLYVRHIGKTARAKALYAGLGSIDITGNMRSVLFLGKDPDNKDRRILAQSKSNNAKEGPSLAYVIETVEQEIWTDEGDAVLVEAPRLQWDGRSELTADDLQAPPEADAEETSALEQAREFVCELLKDGPVLSEDVTNAAKQAGLSWATVKRAKILAGVKARTTQGEGKTPWEWYLDTVDEGSGDVPF